ncbi:uncharacterized protein G2W53_039722 [Senna tora]|uniref:Uncharacterized protein n=1 Tax=Senna tora TaxID=362788 RepID=A0A834W6E1_9FABA|nr:uncharacterized protein G2W53_039722 [Senna tora]
MCCCTSESKRSLRGVFENPSGFNVGMGLVIAWKVCQVKKYKFKRVVAQVRETDRFAFYLGIRVVLMLEWVSRSHGRCIKSSLNTFLIENCDLISKELKKYKFKRVVAQVSQTDRFALYLGIRVVLMPDWGS